jgi:hypothetical protein
LTIAVTVKVHDGIVVASDSATTMKRQIADGREEIVNIYDNANKIFNLRKGFPVGAVTAGAGSIGHSSIATLAKDLRARFSGDDAAHKDWKLNPKTFTVEQVAKRAREFLFEEKWRAIHKDAANIDDLHFWVFGYSANAPLSELWKITVHQGTCEAPVLSRKQGMTGIDWSGQPEAISRLLLGFSPKLREKMLASGKTEEQVQDLFKVFQSWLAAPLYADPMPIMDAISLAEFLVYTTVMYSKFDAGAATVGGPIEIAAITRHENFKWVKRKHYFTPQLNPEA